MSDTKKILVLGATGILGRPVVKSLLAKGHEVRTLVRDSEKLHRLFGDSVETIEGNVLERDIIQAALKGCNAVHINLSQESEIEAMQNVIDLTSGVDLERITYVSATTAREENRWFYIVDIKMRTEEVLKRSGIPYTIFCPTWVMEILNNFVRGDRAVSILGRNPPKLHFFAAEDFGRMVARSYDSDEALGKRLFIHGPEGLLLHHAIERFVNTCHPQLKVRQLKLWQARLIAKLTRRKGLSYVTRLISYFDQVGELGDPTEANALLGKPVITFDEWLRMPEESVVGLPH
jgi:uncharacterized protein YbjT (DUF2867 family)